jgi:hypothetical protein
MEITNHSLHHDQAPGHSPASCQPQCPVCSGLLVPLRDTYRCSRCLFAACVQCEGDTAAAEPAD